MERKTDIAKRMAETRRFKAVGDWIGDVRSERTGSQKTVDMYLRAMVWFSDWVNETQDLTLGRKTTPDDLIRVAKEKLREDPNSQWAERLVKTWFNWMTSDERGLSRNTAKTRYGIMRSFFRYNGIKFVSKTPRATARTRYVIPEKASLEMMWDFADLFERIRIGVLNDTGMRPEDAVGLVYADIKNSFELNEDILYIEKVSEKEDVQFAVCLTRPTTRLMRVYFKHRIRKGEVITDNSPVITEKRNLGKPISTNQLYKDIRDIGKKLGLKISPKIFRKRFRTECSPIIGRDATMKMGGWKIPGAGAHYYLPPKAKTVENYKRVERLLCLEEIASDDEVIVQKRITTEWLKAAGLNPERLLREGNIGTNIRDQAEYLTRHLVGLLNIVRKANENGG